MKLRYWLFIFIISVWVSVLVLLPERNNSSRLGATGIIKPIIINELELFKYAEKRFTAYRKWEKIRTPLCLDGSKEIIVGSGKHVLYSNKMNKVKIIVYPEYIAGNEVTKIIFLHSYYKKSDNTKPSALYLVNNETGEIYTMNGMSSKYGYEIRIGLPITKVKKIGVTAVYCYPIIQD